MVFEKKATYRRVWYIKVQKTCKLSNLVDKSKATGDLNLNDHLSNSLVIKRKVMFRIKHLKHLLNRKRNVQ